MKYSKIFNAKFKSLVIFSAVCFFFSYSFAADSSLCSQCVVKTDGVPQGIQTVCNCQAFCKTVDDNNTVIEDGCKANYYSGQNIQSNPDFAPNWTNALDGGLGIKGREYVFFELEPGMNYRWTTYDKFDDYLVDASEDEPNLNLQYNASCVSDADCGTQMKCYEKNAQGVGHCVWPFDTELTLIDLSGNATCRNGKVLAFSRTGGYHNQAALEYKAPASANNQKIKVALLVTNNQYYDDARGKGYDSCQESPVVNGSKKTTILKWQRYIPDYCKTCGDSGDYAFDNGTPKTNPTDAPNWSVVQDYSYIDMPNFASAAPTENWLKPGSYVDFTVEEGKIYRWSTCKSVFFDTQLTLFKPDDNGGCGQFLAFDDDSDTSYLPQNPWDQSGSNDYCPLGTKQSVVEWHANFSGKVRILFNEYNCSQCSKDLNSPDGLHWTHCFRITDEYTGEFDGQGFPVIAQEGGGETLTYLYSFPLDWQRYDCASCRDTAQAKIADKTITSSGDYTCPVIVSSYNPDTFSGCTRDTNCAGWDSFCVSTTDEDEETVINCGGSKVLQSGQYLTFALKRGSKYVFKTPGRDEVLITVKSGSNCTSGRTLAQGRGQVAYFAESEAVCKNDDDLAEEFSDADLDGAEADPNNYADVVTVLVSEPECDNRDGNINSIELSYSFYSDPFIKLEHAEKAADSKTRFEKVTVPGGSLTTYYTDAATGIRYIEAEQFAGTWEEALNVCKDVSLGGSTGAFDCPTAVCPTIPKCSIVQHIINPGGTRAGGGISGGIGGGSYFTAEVDCYSWDGTLETANTCTAKNDTCAAPACKTTGYEPYIDRIENGERFCDVHPEWCGLCIPGSSYVETEDNKYCNQQKNNQCATNNVCVTKEGNTSCRNRVGVNWTCPADDDYIESDDANDNFCYKTNDWFDIYYDAEEEDADIESANSNVHPNVDELHPIDIRGTSDSSFSCPSGTHYDSENGYCQIDNCGTWTRKNVTSPGAGNNSFCLTDKNLCYTTEEAALHGGISYMIVPCCCNSTITVRGYTAADDPTNANNYKYTLLFDDQHEVHFKNPRSGSCAGAAQTLFCQEPEVSFCEDGYTYKENTNQCYKCVNDGDVIYPFGDNGWLCMGNCGNWIGDGGTPEKRRCVTCEDGSTPVETAEGWKCFSCPDGGTPQKIGGEYKCQKACTFTNEDGTTEAGQTIDNKCYRRVQKVYTCAEGWIEKDGLCKKVETTEAKKYPQCSTGLLASIDEFHTCKNEAGENYAPNTVDCWCKTNKCGIGTQDKVCPESYCRPTTNFIVHADATYIGNVSCKAGQVYAGTHRCCTSLDKYPATMTVNPANGQKVCSFTDLTTNETCGAPSKGWALPDINQLYSLVDFDLYNPATAFPFKVGTYGRTDLVKVCSVDEDCFVPGDSYDGSYICVDGQCARNNWFWSSTTVLNNDSEEEPKFAWAVNLEDGRSYRVLKGCYKGEGDDPDKCTDSVWDDLHARKHQVICIKGSTIAALFHSGRPQHKQIFSGWACDKEKSDNILEIYFEIVDYAGKNIATYEDIPNPDAFVSIPGTTVKGIKYGVTDGMPSLDNTEDDNNSDDYYKIKNNCNGVLNKPYRFKLDLNNPAEGKESIAQVVKSLVGIGTPPYFVTAYAVDTILNTASVIQPSKELFVLKNYCGDTVMTFDGDTTKTENCEKSDWSVACDYTSPWSEDPAHQCQICDQEVCQWTNFKTPGCGDSIIQSKYCVKSGSSEVCGNTEGESCKVSTDDVVYEANHPNCEYYNFGGKGFGDFTEQCDCGNESSVSVYNLIRNANGTYSCGTKIEPDEEGVVRCPENGYSGGNGDEYCVVCENCSITANLYKKPYCGDGRTDTLYGNEECDDGNSQSNDLCVNCKNAKCGDGYVLSNIADSDPRKELCDAGSANGTYAGGCSSDCKTEYKCGDSVIQRSSCSGYSNCVVVPGGTEECDEGNNNNRPITYARFLESLDETWKNKCSATINGVVYPVSSLQTAFNDCLNKYKAFVAAHGCDSDCKKSSVVYCGDGIVQPEAGEVCDQGNDTSKPLYNGRGYKDGCSLDCKLVYGCNDGIIERPTCLDHHITVPCTASDPASKIGIYHPGETINGVDEYINTKKTLLFVNMAEGEVCDGTAAQNGSYGICNKECNGKPFCGDKTVSQGDGEICDRGNVDGGNVDVEDAWAQAKEDSCLGVFVPKEGEDAGKNICTDAPSKWAQYGVSCCQYGRYCGDGIIDNILEGVGSANAEGVVANRNEWREDREKWIPYAEDGESPLLVLIDDINLAVDFTIKEPNKYQDVELDIEIPIVPGYRYFVEYDVKVVRQNNETASMHAGAKMYGSDGSALDSCDEPGCLATNPRYFVDNSDDPMGEGWIHGKNSQYMRLDGTSSSNFNWLEGTDHVKLYFQFKSSVKYTEFLIRGLKIYTLEAGKDFTQGNGADEMCDNGAGNLGVDAVATDDSYMSGCTAYVYDNDNHRVLQTGCRWTNYCGDARKHSREACDNGTNKTNVYNGCEPGCTEIGPHCGDGILDIRPSDVCPYTLDPSRCNFVEEKFSLDTAHAYDDSGNFKAKPVTFSAEYCDNAGNNDDKSVGTEAAPELIKEEDLDPNNYGTCRTDCTLSRCGDGIVDYVVPKVKDGDEWKPKKKINENGQEVYAFAEECDCGFVPSDAVLIANGYFYYRDGVETEANKVADPMKYYNANILHAPAGYENDKAYALNQKTSEGIYICRDAEGHYFGNSNYGSKNTVSCRSDCTISRCGDGIKDLGEECDDGNNDDHDDCTNNCKLKSSCGDGIFSFKRSYLCEELMDLTVAQMKIMRDRGVVDCCDANDDACTANGTPLCSALAKDNGAGNAQGDLKSETGAPYGEIIHDSGKRALHYWFDKKVLHCCFNNKYITGDNINDDDNCINRTDGHVFYDADYPDFGSVSTLKDYVYYNCRRFQSVYTDPWEPCDNVSYSERCEACDLDPNKAKCGCDKLWAAGSSAYNDCIEKCRQDPCGCKAYCEYKNPGVPLASLTECVSACETRNRYCDSTCWNITGSCGDGIKNKTCIGGYNAAGECIGKTVNSEQCDNFKTSGGYSDLNGNSQTTTPPAFPSMGPGGNYCTGPCIGECTPESPMCGGGINDKCWQTGCSEANHGSEEPSKCGDGMKDVYAGEFCDSGNKNGSYNYCNETCSGLMAYCGNGIVENGVKDQPRVENCDKGSNNGKYTVAVGEFCDTSCNTVGGGSSEGRYCGDNIIQVAANGDCDCTPGDTECTGTDSQGLVCMKGVQGAVAGTPAETCETGDKRTQTLTNAGETASDLCSTSCVQADKCGDGKRNPRFEGCDCAANNTGAGTCSVTYGDTAFSYTCHANCKADPIGNLETVSPIEISGWACDPDHPMAHPDGLVEIEFYAKDGTTPLLTVPLSTSRSVSNDIIRACGGGSGHGWFYNPKEGGTGVTDFENQNPITVKVFAVPQDSGESRVQIGEQVFTMGQQCNDGIITKCEDIKIALLGEESGSIKHGDICYDETNSSSCSGTGCVVVKGTCKDYGLTNAMPCLDEDCDEGKGNNGDDKKCSSKCFYTYCGDGTIQAPNGRANLSTPGYKEDNYDNSAFTETCEKDQIKTCSTLGLTKPAGTNFMSINAPCKAGSAVAAENTCVWDPTVCKIEQSCPALNGAVAGKNWKNRDNQTITAAGSVIHYASGTSNPKYERTWNGSAWMPAELQNSDLHHKSYFDGENDTDHRCRFECWNETNATGTKLVWDSAKNQCVEQDYTSPCAACNDANGVWSNGVECKKTVPSSPTSSNWKMVTEKIKIETNGSITTVVSKNEPAFNSGTCSYTCKSGTQYITNKGCLANEKTVSCNNALLTDHAKWAKVTKVTGSSTGEYNIARVDSLSVTVNVNSAGEYNPPAPVFAEKTNIVSGSTVDENRCYFLCEVGYRYDNGTQTCKQADPPCGDGKIQTKDCSDKSGYTVGKVDITWGGKTVQTDCYYEPDPNAQEACDDGAAVNGHYSKNGVNWGGAKVSVCNATCTDRIKKDGNFALFCGDGRVQVAKGSPAATNCSTGSLTCDALNADNIGSMYTGATTFNTTDSEGCEASDTQIQGQSTATVRDKLCKAKHGNRTFYDSGLAPSCDNCTINDSNGACQFCGDGTKNGSEDCDSNTSQSELCRLKLGVSRSYYETTNKPSCTVGTGTNACKTAGITNATAGTTCAWCGDGTKNGNEECDNGSSNVSSYTCPHTFSSSNSCQYCNTSCKKANATGPYCGDGSKNGTEVCDTAVSYSCYESTSWTTGSGNDEESHSGYNVYIVTCSGCTSRSKSSSACATQTSSQTCSGYTNLGECSSL